MRAVFFLVVGVFGVLGAGVPAFAEDGQAPAAGAGASLGDPVHIGTFRIQPPHKPISTRSGVPVGDDAVVGDDDGSSMVDSSLGADVGEPGGTAAALLSRALFELEGNRIVRARRYLELLVADFPDSVEANTARRHLARFYSGIGTDTAAVAKPAVPASVPAPVLSVNKPLSRMMGLSVGDRVFFAPGSDKLGSKARSVLRGQAEWLRSHKRLRVLISGHADEPGSEDDNDALALRRTIVVRERLIEEGVGEGRIETNSLGRTSPIATCGEPVCAAQNRRVVTMVLRSKPLRVRAKTRTGE